MKLNKKKECKLPGKGIIEIEKELVMKDGAKYIENIFFAVTCISVFTCVVRSDYNFAMGLLSYYMIKNIS